MALTFGTVRGSFDDTIPSEEVPITGTITFTPEAEWLLSPTSQPQKVILPTPKKVTLTSAAFEVQLLGTDNVGLNPTDWTYRVEFDLTMSGIKWAKSPISIHVASDQITDLSLATPVAKSEGIPTVVGPKGDIGPKGDTGPVGPALPDTGYRYITSSVSVRRIGNVVHWNVEYGSAGTGNKLNKILSIPSGFRAYYSDHAFPAFPTMVGNTTADLSTYPPAAFLIRSFYSDLSVNGGNGVAYTGAFSHTTNDPWPTTLPGTAF